MTKMNGSDVPANKPVETPVVNDELVKLLTAMLADAKDGKLLAMAAIIVSGVHQFSLRVSGNAFGEFDNGASLLKHRINTVWSEAMNQQVAGQMANRLVRAAPGDMPQGPVMPIPRR